MKPKEIKHNQTIPNQTNLNQTKPNSIKTKFIKTKLCSTNPIKLTKPNQPNQIDQTKPN